MNDKYQATIDALEDELVTIEKEATDIKGTINSLCRRAGIPERFAVTETGAAPSLGNLRADQFYGRPLATVITEYVELRRDSGLGPATVAEIYEALKGGGYNFDARTPEYAKRGLRQSLTKNAKFHKLPGGEYGLTEWYPKIKESKENNVVTEEDDVIEILAERRLGE